jgi:hypothetical protein
MMCGVTGPLRDRPSPLEISIAIDDKFRTPKGDLRSASSAEKRHSAVEFLACVFQLQGNTREVPYVLRVIGSWG